jgi:hypothetical protein
VGKNVSRNPSELLFEEYLTAHDYKDWAHEVPMQGKRKNPDYRLEYGGSSLFFEIKEFEAPLAGNGPYDPYGAIREKINRATRQFREYKDFPCSIVLANPKSAFVHLDVPEIMIGSMLGNLGFQYPLSGGSSSAGRQVFGKGGKMVDDKRQKPQNTTISAIVALEHYPLRKNLLELALHEWERTLGRKATAVEAFEFLQTLPKTSTKDVLRVLVFENPYARIPLNRNLFRGPFDVRWGVREVGILARMNVGEELQKLEEQLARIDRRSPIQRWIDRRREQDASEQAER